MTSSSCEYQDDVRIKLGMTTNLKAIYEKGVLRLETTLPLPEGAEVVVIVTTHEEDNGEPSQGI